MHDIANVAKQVEQEITSRSTAGQKESPRGHSEVDIIDVPATVQASVLHEKGVRASVGAALFADRLPLGVSPPSVEDDWLKALLHVAVNHSIIRPNPHQSNVRLAENFPLLDALVDKRLQSRQSSRDPEESVASRCLPLRVEMPSRPHPHPEQLVNPLHSISETSRRRPFDRDRLARLLFYVRTYLAARPFRCGLHYPNAPMAEYARTHRGRARLPSASPHHLAASSRCYPCCRPPTNQLEMTAVDVFCGSSSPPHPRASNPNEVWRALNAR